MKKWIFLILSVLLMLVGGSYLYVTQVFIPVQLKGILREQAREALKRNISFGEISYSLFNGFLVKDFIIFQKEKPTEPMVKVKEARFNIFIPDILTKKKILIPSITLHEPWVLIVRDKEQGWNFSDLLSPNEAARSETKNPFTFFLGSVTIEGGQFQVVDVRAEPPWQETFAPTKANINLSLTRGVRFDVTTQTTSRSGRVKTSGEYRIDAPELQGQIALDNIDLGRILSLFDLSLPITLAEGLITQTDLTVNWSPTAASLKGELKALASIVLPDKGAVKGNFQLTRMNLDKKENSFALSAEKLHTEGLDVNLINNGAFGGNLSGQNISFTSSDGTVSLKGDFAVEKGYSLLSENRTFSGSPTLSRLDFTRSDKTLAIAGDLIIPDALFHFGPEQKLRGNLNVSGFQLQKKETGFEGTARLNLENIDFERGIDRFKGNLLSDKITIRGLPNAIQANTSFQLSKADIQWGKDTKLRGNIIAKNTSFRLENQILSVQATGQTEDIVTVLPSGMSFHGSPQISLALQYHLRATEDPFSYSGNMIFNSASIKAVPKVGDINNLRGKIDFQKDKISTDKLTFSLLEAPVVLTGFGKNFNDLFLDIKATGEQLPLVNVAAAFSDLLAKYKITPSSGSASFNFSFSGQLREWNKGQLLCSVYMDNATLSGEKWPSPLTQVNGALEYADKTITWKHLSLTWKDQVYILDGYYQLSGEPLAETKLSSEGLLLTTRVRLWPDHYEILSLQGKIFNSTFSGQGRITPQKEGLPLFSCSTQIDLELKDLPQLFPAQTKKLTSLRPRGLITLKTSFDGPPDQWRKSKINLTAQAGQVGIAGFVFKNVSADLEHGEKELSHFNLKGLLADGELSVDILADPKQETIPAQLSFDLTGSSLATMARDGVWPQKEISGLLNARFKLDGPLLKTAAVTGRGNFTITDGQLWKLNILKGIWKVLLIPELENVIFTDAAATLTVKENRLFSQDLILKSQPLDLTGRGWIDMDQNINMLISPNFHQLEILKSQGNLQKSLTALLSQAEGSLGIRLSGKLPNPDYKKEVRPVKVIQNAAENLIEGVQGIIENILP